MSQCVISQLFKLNELICAKPKDRKKLLEKANTKLIKSIVECIENVLKGNLRLKKQSSEKLRKHKSVLRKIYNSGKKLKEKKQIIVQNGGGFLPILLAPVVAALAERFISRK